MNDGLNLVNFVSLRVGEYNRCITHIHQVYFIIQDENPHNQPCIKRLGGANLVEKLLSLDGLHFASLSLDFEILRVCEMLEGAAQLRYGKMST